MQFVPKLFSVLQQGYSLRDCRRDMLAGLTVAIVSLPLAMALAIASGTTPEKGLITAVIAGFLISLLGGSRVQIGGPTGAFVVVVFNGIAQYGYDGMLVATFMAGIMLIIAGYARFGQVIKFIPHPVITGFTSGIAVIIASSQVKDFFGMQIEKVPADFIPKWATYFSHLDAIQLPTFLIGFSALIAILVMRRFAPKLPGYLIAVALAAIVVTAFHIPTDTIGTHFHTLSTGFVMPSMPEISFEKIRLVMPLAFTIAFLAGIESLLSAVVADGMTGFKHRSNQELIGQGVANIASTLFGGIPATGAIARTATNVKSGGRTPVAGLFNAIFIAIFMLFAMDYISYVPLAALAAILFVVAWGMSEVHQFIHIFSLCKTDRIVLLLTFALTILLDLTIAIAVGVILASLIFMREMSKSVAISNQAEDLGEEEEVQRNNLPKGVEVFRIAGPVFFAVASDLYDTLKLVGSVPKVLIIRMSLVPFIDGTGVTTIANLIKDFSHKNTHIILSGVQKQPREFLDRAGINQNTQHLSFAENYEQAINLATAQIN